MEGQEREPDREASHTHTHLGSAVIIRTCTPLPYLLHPQAKTPLSLLGKEFGTPIPREL